MSVRRVLLDIPVWEVSGPVPGYDIVHIGVIYNAMTPQCGSSVVQVDTGVVFY